MAALLKTFSSTTEEIVSQSGDVTFIVDTLVIEFV